MASAVDSRLAYARLSAVATASRLPTANRGSNNSYTTSWDTTALRNGYSIRIISKSNMASSMTAWISGSFRPEPAGSSCCCFTWPRMLLMGGRW